MFIFATFSYWTIQKQLTDVQILRRSYQFYDKDKSNSISKKELVQTLLELGKVKGNFNLKGKYLSKCFKSPRIKLCYLKEWSNFHNNKFCANVGFQKASYIQKTLKIHWIWSRRLTTGRESQTQNFSLQTCAIKDSPTFWV